MTMKLRKISETAYRDAPAGGVGKRFNYAKAFVLFGIVAAVLLVATVLFAQHISGRVTSSEAWLDPREEIGYEADSSVRIEAIYVTDGRMITQADIDSAIAAQKKAGEDELGFLLYTTVSDSGSVGEGEIAKWQSIIAQHQTNLALAKSGANMGYADNNKLVSELRIAADKLSVATGEQKSAQADYDIANEECERAEQYFSDRLVTIDTLNDAKLRQKKTDAKRKATEEIRQRAQNAYNDCAKALIKTILLRSQDISDEEREEIETLETLEEILKYLTGSEGTETPETSEEIQEYLDDMVENTKALATPEEIQKSLVRFYEQKLKEAEAELEIVKAKQGINKYYTTKPGRVYALKVEKGMRVADGDPILKIFNPRSIEIVARMDGNLARDVRNGQEADITVNIGAKVVTLSGKVRSISNPLFERSKKDRDRLRTEFTNVDFTLREIHIEFDVSELSDEDIAALAPGNSAKVTIHTN